MLVMLVALLLTAAPVPDCLHPAVDAMHAHADLHPNDPVVFIEDYLAFAKCARETSGKDNYQHLGSVMGGVYAQQYAAEAYANGGHHQEAVEHYHLAISLARLGEDEAMNLGSARVAVHLAIMEDRLTEAMRSEEHK